MTKIRPYEDNAAQAMLENLKAMTNIFASYPALENAVRQANMIFANPAVHEAMELTRQFDNVFSTNAKVVDSFVSAFRFQNDLLFSTQKFYLTESLSAFRNSLMHNNFFSAIEAITKSLQSAIIEVPNISLLKLNKPLLGLIGEDLPRGLRSSIDTLHTKTAIDLSISESIRYNSKEATFFVGASPDSMCKAKEVNVIYSIARLFCDLTEEDMIALQGHLSTYSSLGLAHYAGQKMMEIVKSIDTTISFDSEFFYHARTIEEGVAPYTNEDMTSAPHGITSFGRFNHIGDNYYYFSDQKLGAIEEVRKHTPKNRVQVATLRPRGKIRMVDISQNEENVFLKYCRFPFDSSSRKKIPREYLIPSFFSDCCKLQGFDGIKYFGTQSYKNYVTWKDGHFDFMTHEIFDMTKKGID